MTAREIEARRRRRERREALANAELEFANGGPLYDAFRPIMGPGMSDAQYWVHLQAELARRSEIVNAEGRRLAIYFADRCWVVMDEQRRMVASLASLLATVGPPKAAPTHSTLPGATSSTIPRLES